MTAYFTRERFGRPQFLAGLLLLAFLAQGAWLVRTDASVATRTIVREHELMRITEGWRQWHGAGIAGAPYSDQLARILKESLDTEHSPLLPLVTAAPPLVLPEPGWNWDLEYWRWLPRLPFLACGVFLGASLWYVARRLCGNVGGFIALTLYCFSPSLIQASAVWEDTEPNIVAAWGAFGTVFTSIAVAHTLYAPREVVLWNWRRTLLLGVSLAIAIGSQFSMIVLVPVALVFLLYVAPVRRRAGLVIWLAACAVGLLVFLSFYFFHLHAFAASMRCADFWDLDWHGLAMLGAYKSIGAEIGRACPALALLAPVALATYAVWPRTRYFGNTAPLVVGALFVALALAHPNAVQGGFLLATVPFLFIFVAGVLADLMQTRYSRPVAACVVALLAVYILRSLIALAHVPRG